MSLSGSRFPYNDFGKGSCIQCCNRRNCLIDQLKISEIRDFSYALRHPKPLRRGEHLYVRGNKFYSIFIVKSGSLKTCITDTSGDYQVTGFYLPGDILGVDGLNTGQHMYDVEALETSSLCAVSYDHFEHVSDANHGKLYRQLIRHLNEMAMQNYDQMFILGKMHANQRLASFLLSMSKRMHDRKHSGYEFFLSMTRYDIANYLGLAVETVSRLFKHFKTDGLITTDHRFVRIKDKGRLQDIVSRAYKFSSLSDIA